MNKFSILNIKFSVLSAIFFILPFSQNVYAQSTIFTQYIGSNPSLPGQSFTIQNFFNLIVGLACWFIRFGIIAVGIMVVVYGLMFLLSRGETSKFSNTKKAFNWGIVGGLVIMGVFTIILSIPAILGSLSGNQVSYPITKIFSSC